MLRLFHFLGYSHMYSISVIRKNIFCLSPQNICKFASLDIAPVKIVTMFLTRNPNICPPISTDFFFVPSSVDFEILLAPSEIYKNVWNQIKTWAKQIQQPNSNTNPTRVRCFFIFKKNLKEKIKRLFCHIAFIRYHRRCCFFYYSCSIQSPTWRPVQLM